VVEPGDYSDTFRALGKFFDEVGALDIQIEDAEEVLHARWKDRLASPASLDFTAEELQALRTASRFYRGLSQSPRGLLGSRLMVEGLRTLGRELDAMGARGVSVIEEQDGFVISATVDDAEVTQVLRYEDLKERSRTLEGERQPASFQDLRNAASVAEESRDRRK